MDIRLLHGAIRRLIWRPVRSTGVDRDSATEFSMTQSATDAGAVTLRLCGEIDLTCRDSLRNRLIAIADIDHPDRLLIDLDGVTFLDCSGIGALIAGRNAALAAGCRYEVRNSHGIVGTILWACGVEIVFGIDPAPASDSVAV